MKPIAKWGNPWEKPFKQIDGHYMDSTTTIARERSSSISTIKFVFDAPSDRIEYTIYRVERALGWIFEKKHLLQGHTPEIKKVKRSRIPESQTVKIVFNNCCQQLLETVQNEIYQVVVQVFKEELVKSSKSKVWLKVLDEIQAKYPSNHSVNEELCQFVFQEQFEEAFSTFLTVETSNLPKHAIEFLILVIERKVQELEKSPEALEQMRSRLQAVFDHFVFQNLSLDSLMRLTRLSFGYSHEEISFFALDDDQSEFAQKMLSVMHKYSPALASYFVERAEGAFRKKECTELKCIFTYQNEVGALFLSLHVFSQQYTEEDLQNWLQILLDTKINDKEFCVRFFCEILEACLNSRDFQKRQFFLDLAQELGKRLAAGDAIKIILRAASKRTTYGDKSCYLIYALRFSLIVNRVLAHYKRNQMGTDLFQGLIFKGEDADSNLRKNILKALLSLYWQTFESRLFTELYIATFAKHPGMFWDNLAYLPEEALRVLPIELLSLEPDVDTGSPLLKHLMENGENVSMQAIALLQTMFLQAMQGKKIGFFANSLIGIPQKGVRGILILLRILKADKNLSCILSSILCSRYHDLGRHLFDRYTNMNLSDKQTLEPLLRALINDKQIHALLNGLESKHIETLLRNIHTTAREVMGKRIKGVWQKDDSELAGCLQCCLLFLQKLAVREDTGHLKFWIGLWLDNATSPLHSESEKLVKAFGEQINAKIIGLEAKDSSEGRPGIEEESGQTASNWLETANTAITKIRNWMNLCSFTQPLQITQKTGHLIYGIIAVINENKKKIPGFMSSAKEDELPQFFRIVKKYTGLVFDNPQADQANTVNPNSIGEELARKWKQVNPIAKNIISGIRKKILEKLPQQIASADAAELAKINSQLHVLRNNLTELLLALRNKTIPLEGALPSYEHLREILSKSLTDLFGPSANIPHLLTVRNRALLAPTANAGDSAEAAPKKEFEAKFNTPEMRAYYTLKALIKEDAKNGYTKITGYIQALGVEFDEVRQFFDVLQPQPQIKQTSDGYYIYDLSSLEIEDHFQLCNAIKNKRLS